MFAPLAVSFVSLPRGSHIHYHYGIRSPKTKIGMAFLGPNSIVRVYGPSRLSHG